MKRLALAMSLVFGACATTGVNTTAPACLATVEHDVIQAAAKRAMTILVSGASKDVIAKNLEDLTREVGPETFNCAIDYIKARL